MSKPFGCSRVSIYPHLLRRFELQDQQGDTREIVKVTTKKKLDSGYEKCESKRIFFSYYHCDEREHPIQSDNMPVSCNLLLIVGILVGVIGDLHIENRWPSRHSN